MKKDEKKTKAQLIDELVKLRRRITELKAAETERNRAEKALRESEAKYRILFNNIADPVFIFDQETNRFLDCNQTAISRYKYSLDELRTMTPVQLHPPDEVKVVEKNISDKENHSPHCYTHITKDGNSLQVEVHTDELEYEGRKVWISIVRDITERKRAEEELRKHRDQLEELVEERTRKLMTTNKQLQQEITDHKRVKERLTKMNECFLSFGANPSENINRLTALCGETLDATCALYNRLDKGLLCSWGQWNTPPDYNPVDKPEGHICYDAIQRGKVEAFVVRNLLETPYAQTDPNVIPYKLQTYVGWPVKFDDAYVGSLCVVYQNDFVPSEADKRFMGIIASAVGVEEKRKQAEEELRKHRNHLEELVKERTTELTIANEQLRREITERKHVEKALSEERNLLRTLIDNLPDHIYVKDTESRFLIVNKAVVHTIGATTPSELVGKTDFDFPYPPGMAEQYYADEQAIIESGQPLINREESNIDRETGATIWFLTAKVPFKDSQGNIVGIMGTAHDITNRKRMEEELRKHQDQLEELVKERTAELTTANEQLRQEITERKRAEEALRESEEKFRQLAENINLIFTLRTEDELIYASPAYEKITGRSLKSYYENPDIFLEYIHPEDRERITRIHYGEELKKTGVVNTEYRIIRPDGTIRWLQVRAVPVLNEQGEITRRAGFTEDISERKRIEKELYQAKEAAEAANQAKSEFLANMSHELRTPLNGVLGYAQILKRDRSLTEQQREAIEIVERSGEHLLMMIEDILDLSKIEAGKMELKLIDFYLPELVRTVGEIAQIQAQQKGISLDEKIASELRISVYGDKTRLRQVLLNLLGNAIKFTETGSVVLKVEAIIEKDQDGRHFGSDAHLTRFQIEDTGVGIPADRVKEIFEPFRQVKNPRIHSKGIGLGLAISQRLLRMMDSELHVESTIGEGSTFWFDVELPKVERIMASRVKPSLNIIGFKGSKRNVLLVDNDIDNLTVLREMLLPLGFEIAEAIHGRDALDKVATFHPDIILMDLLMPEMDGFEATRRIRELETGYSILDTRYSILDTSNQHPASSIQHPASSIQHPASSDQHPASSIQHPVIIAVSASAFEQTRQESAAAGCDDFLVKPVDIDDLLERLRVHLNLEWLYENELDGRHFETFPERGRRGVAHPLEHIIPPPAGALAPLCELIRKGDIMGVYPQADQIEQLDQKYAPFAIKVRQLAKAFRIDELEAFINSYMEDKT